MQQCIYANVLDPAGLKDVARCWQGARSIAYQASGMRTSLPETFTGDPNSTWGLDTKALDAAPLVWIIKAHSARIRVTVSEYCPTMCAQTKVVTSAGNIKQEIGDADACDTRIDITSHAKAVQEIASGTKPTARAPEQYPLARFIEPTQYGWDNDFFAAEEAVRAYLKNSHADY